MEVPSPEAAPSLRTQWPFVVHYHDARQAASPPLETTSGSALVIRSLMAQHHHRWFDFQELQGPTEPIRGASGDPPYGSPDQNYLKSAREVGGLSLRQRPGLAITPQETRSAEEVHPEVSEDCGPASSDTGLRPSLHRPHKSP